jgi:hypothetical protein
MSLNKTCEICGRNVPKLFNRWYVYANGQQEISGVCSTCADVHAELTNN